MCSPIVASQIFPEGAELVDFCWQIHIDLLWEEEMSMDNSGSDFN